MSNNKSGYRRHREHNFHFPEARHSCVVSSNKRQSTSEMPARMANLDLQQYQSGPDPSYKHKANHQELGRLSLFTANNH